MSVTGFIRQNGVWLAAGGLLTFMSSFGQTFFISVFAGEIRAAFDLSHGAWGGIYSLGTTASAAVMIWAGSLTDIFRVRVLGPMVLLGLAAACVMMALNPLIWLLPVTVFLLRLFGQGLASHIAVVAMSRWFIATRGRALSIASLGFSVGEATLPLIFVALMIRYDWHLLWILAAVICLAGIPALIVMLRQERTPQSLASVSANTGMMHRNWSRAEALRHPLFWFMVPALVGPSAFGTAFFFHQAHFAEIKDWAHVQLVALFPLYTGFSILAMIVSGWALDRFGTARLMPFYQLPMTLCFLVFAAADRIEFAIPGFFFFALTTGANATLPNAFWAEFYGTAHLGEIKAMAAAVMVLGSAIGPGITGLLIDLGIGLESQFVAVAAYFLITTISMFVGIRRVQPQLGQRPARRR